MEQIEILKQNVAEFVNWCEQAAKATTYAEADEAKVEGLKSHIRLMQQTNRVRSILIDLAADARIRLNQAKQDRVASLTAAAIDVNEPTPIAEPKPKVAKKTAKAKKTK